MKIMKSYLPFRFIYNCSLVAILLSACITSQPTSTATQAPTITPVSTATLTETPGPTDTPKATFTSTPIAKEVTYQDFANIDWSDFTFVTHEQRLVLSVGVVEGTHILPEDVNSVKSVSFTPNIYINEGASVAMYCYTNINCAPRYIVSEETEYGIIPMVIWELIVQNSNAENVRVSLVTVHEPELEEFRGAQLRYLREIGKGNQTIKVTLIAEVKRPRSDFWKTVLLYSPDPNSMALWIIENQNENQLILATNILGR